MKRKVTVITVAILLTASLSVFAQVDPSWYTTQFNQNSSTMNNTKNFQWELNSIYLGYLQIKRNDDLTNQYTWSELQNLWDSAHQELTWVFTANESSPTLRNVEDPSLYFDVKYTITVGGSNSMNTSPKQIETNLGISSINDGQIRMSITPRNKYRYGWEGTYETTLNVQIFAEYGTENQVLIDEYMFFIQMYYIEQGEVPEPVVTDLQVVPYSSAENIDVEGLHNSGGTLVVGSVTFTSNDDDLSSDYSLKISPKIDPDFGDFEFTHETNSSILKYKVYVPGRTLPSAGSFSVDVPGLGTSGYWQDFIEIAVSDLNYTSNYLFPGEYTSDIIIELVSD